ncbi:hypothetical protein D3C81_2046520 [compost metagenome]
MKVAIEKICKQVLEDPTMQMFLNSDEIMHERVIKIVEDGFVKSVEKQIENSKEKQESQIIKQDFKYNEKENTEQER